MIRRQKATIFLQCKETDSVLEVKSSAPAPGYPYPFFQVKKMLGGIWKKDAKDIGLFQEEKEKGELGFKS